MYCHKVDIWAVGVMMFKMLFGDFPFKSNPYFMKVSIWSMKLTQNVIKVLILRRLR